MKYYCIAGEASGDLHASFLLSALNALDPQAQFRAWGGDLMQAQGAELDKHIRELAIMGPVEVLLKIFKIFQNFAECKKNILDFQPDVLILIDYSGFNLRMAKWAKSQGLKVVYYISPQVWASRASRVEKIKQYVDEMYVILPFEEEFYRQRGMKVHYVGHPLIEVVDKHQPNPDFLAQNNLSADQPIIALLPGSRKQEIRSILSLMLTVLPNFPKAQFVVAGAPSLEPEFYRNFLAPFPQVTFVQNQTYDLMAHSQAALVTSGTATLEAALFELPQLVCYKTHPIFYWIAKQIIKVPYISLVNLIMQKELVPELIQNDLNPQRLKMELQQLFEDENRQRIAQEYKALRNKLGQAGAPQRVAQGILKFLAPPKN
ncbi:lipid-A-disaccharide synthase [Saprospira grandis]|uniref:lipid-A-disaccharide synthase n=1 Tax=Saprospira grandis TaxID=1008 RepID=UPI0022DD9E98|nr:lipid-A-disaccharide synthase [Saprospira grandis]WBM75122.1 lipid-A-disaccharide synthase [Saprospira grandis]